MRFQATIVAFAASLALTGAQDLSSVPQCALPCLIQAVPSSGCTTADIKCQCTTGQAKLAESLTACIPKACSADDQAKVTPALLQICKSAGITVSVPASAASAASAAASAASSAGSAVASGAASATSKTASASASGASGAPAEASKAAAPANMAGLGAVALGLAAFL